MVPLTKVEVTTDKMSVNANLSYGQRPLLLFCVFVNSTAMRGEISMNPLKFEHMCVTESYVNFDGKRFPETSIKSDFPTQVGDLEFNATDLYVNFLKAIGMYNGTRGNGMTIDDFVGGNTVFSYILSENDLISGASVASDEKGFTSVNFTFGKAPENNCELWAFGVFNSKIQLTRDLVVIADHVPGSSS